MDRLTIPDVQIDEHTTRRTIIDGNAVREHAMEFYWRLKAIENIMGDEYDLDQLREMVQAEEDSIPECGTKVFVLTTAEYWSKKHSKPEIIECVVTTHRLRRTGQIAFSADGRWNSGSYYKAVFAKTSIGKTVFLTREEAEAALAVQKGDTQ